MGDVMEFGKQRKEVSGVHPAFIILMPWPRN
jgi:hypothetical protein